MRIPQPFHWAIISRRWTRRTSEGKSDSSKSKSPGTPPPGAQVLPPLHPVHPQPGGGSHVPSFKRPRTGSARRVWGRCCDRCGASRVGVKHLWVEVRVGKPGARIAAGLGAVRGRAEGAGHCPRLGICLPGLRLLGAGRAEGRGEAAPARCCAEGRQWHDTGPGGHRGRVKFTDTGCQVCLFLSGF